MRLFRLLSILSLVAVLALSFFSFFSSDDLCYRNELARYPVFEKAWLQYLHWDGRSLGLPSILQLFLLKHATAAAGAVVWTICFCLIGFLMVRLIRLDGKFQQQVPFWIHVSLVIAMLWLGMWKLVPDLIYWPTGGWNIAMALQCVVWIYMLRLCLRRKMFIAGNYVFIFVVSILAGAASHNAAPALLVIAFAELAFASIIQKDKKAVRFMLIVLAGLISGAAILFYSPGNGERLQAIQWQGITWAFAQNWLIVFARYLYWLAALFLLLALYRHMAGEKLLPEFQLNALKGKPSAQSGSAARFTAAIYPFRYLLAAFATILVFGATSFFAVPRTAVFFGLLIAMHVFINGQPGKKSSHNFFVTGATLVQLIFFSIIVYEGVGAARLQQEMKAREKVYASHQGEDVVVEKIAASNVPFAFTFSDLSADSEDWINRCVAFHYGLKTVRTNEQ